MKSDVLTLCLLCGFDFAGCPASAVALPTSPFLCFFFVGWSQSIPNGSDGPVYIPASRPDFCGAAEPDMMSRSSGDELPVHGLRALYDGLPGWDLPILSAITTPPARLADGSSNCAGPLVLSWSSANGPTLSTGDAIEGGRTFARKPAFRNTALCTPRRFCDTRLGKHEPKIFIKG